MLGGVLYYMDSYVQRRFRAGHSKSGLGLMLNDVTQMKCGKVAD